jgi:hypothetical protein
MRTCLFMITKVLSIFVLKQHRLCQYPRCFIVDHNEIGFYNRNGVTLKVLVKQDGAKENIGRHDHKCVLFPKHLGESKRKD